MRLIIVELYNGNFPMNITLTLANQNSTQKMNYEK